MSMIGAVFECTIIIIFICLLHYTCVIVTSLYTRNYYWYFYIYNSLRADKLILLIIDYFHFNILLNCLTFDKLSSQVDGIKLTCLIVYENFEVFWNQHIHLIFGSYNSFHPIKTIIIMFLETKMKGV